LGKESKDAGFKVYDYSKIKHRSPNVNFGNEERFKDYSAIEFKHIT
jgi:hypothetical protein